MWIFPFSHMLKVRTSKHSAALIWSVVQACSLFSRWLTNERRCHANFTHVIYIYFLFSCFLVTIIQKWRNSFSSQIVFFLFFKGSFRSLVRFSATSLFCFGFLKTHASAATDTFGSYWTSECIQELCLLCVSGEICWTWSLTLLGDANLVIPPILPPCLQDRFAAAVSVAMMGDNQTFRWWVKRALSIKYGVKRSARHWDASVCAPLPSLFLLLFWLAFQHLIWNSFGLAPLLFLLVLNQRRSKVNPGDGHSSHSWE